MNLKLSLSICLLFISTTIFSEVTPHFNKIVFFGDSLSDNGNFYGHSAHLMPKYPPYFQGRFSNGYNWADLVSNELFSRFNITADNYAVGGATTILHNPLEGYLPVTLTMERDDYNLHNLLSDKSNTLYVIWIGANDYLPGNKNVDEATTSVINTLTATIQSLVTNSGAAFLIIGMPDLSLTPQASLSGLSENYKALTDSHNKKLHTAIMYLHAQYPNHTFMEFNFQDQPILNWIVNSPTYRAEINHKYSINITNVKDACWEDGFTQTSEKNIQVQLSNLDFQMNQGSTIDTVKLAHEIANSPSLSEAYRVQQLATQKDMRCAEPDQHLFWDQVHPSAVTHKVLANIFLDVILKNQN